MTQILIVYYHLQTYPMRKTIEDHIFSFEKFSNADCYFLNVAFGVPNYITWIQFDLVIYQTIFLGTLRWQNITYEKWAKRYEKLKFLSGTKIILPQDEFLNSNNLCKFIFDFNINKVFSVAPKSEWGKIYPGIDQNEINFHEVLTGYLDEEIGQTIKKLAMEIPYRSIDIGYRAWHAEYWLGRHGILKTKIAELFNEIGPQHKLIVDISTDNQKTFLGLDWYRFLLSCKYTIGVEGGGSILDCDGTIRKRVNQYLKQNPKASFEEVEKHCFLGEDGKLKLFALSPRHLEACATKTCQILIEGNYNGILKPDIHYIEIKKDFSNLDDVLKKINDDKYRKQIVDRAFEDTIKSNKYTYHSFVKRVLELSIGETCFKSKRTILHKFNVLREKALWTIIRIDAGFRAILKRNLPKPIVIFIRNRKLAKANR